MKVATLYPFKLYEFSSINTLLSLNVSKKKKKNIRALFAHISELTRVTHEKGYHRECHESSIEDVYGPFHT